MRSEPSHPDGRPSAPSPGCTNPPANSPATAAGSDSSHSRRTRPHGVRLLASKLTTRGRHREAQAADAAQRVAGKARPWRRSSSVTCRDAAPTRGRVTLWRRRSSAGTAEGDPPFPSLAPPLPRGLEQLEPSPRPGQGKRARHPVNRRDDHTSTIPASPVTSGRRALRQARPKRLGEPIGCSSQAAILTVGASPPLDPARARRPRRARARRGLRRRQPGSRGRRATWSTVEAPPSIAASRGPAAGLPSNGSDGESLHSIPIASRTSSTQVTGVGTTTEEPLAPFRSAR